MSKRKSGCVSFIFGSCARKRNRERIGAVSVENSEFRGRINEIATQTQDQIFRSSAPASLFPSAHKPIIAIRDSKGFHIQEVSKDRLIINNDEVKNNFLPSLGNSVEIEAIQNEHNDDPMVSSKSLHQFFLSNSPRGLVKAVPNPFMWGKNGSKPKLMPITPGQFFKRKILPSNQPIKPLERMIHENALSSYHRSSTDESNI